jgi:hypothetical protein
VAEGTRLLSGRRGNPTEGSNPSLSAELFYWGWYSASPFGVVPLVGVRLVTALRPDAFTSECVSPR